LIGWARTARSAVAPEIPDQPYVGEIALVDSLARDDVVVADVADDSSAFWGELFSAAAMGRGARGLVVGGLVRDLDRIRELGFPVFASGTRPTDCNGRIAVVERDRELDFRGVSVRTGDLVVADADGVVFVPRDAVREVTEVALSKARTESDAKQLLLDGGTLGDVWARHRVL
jgi:regulator of RNase E activity RraA